MIFSVLFACFLIGCSSSSTPVYLDISVDSDGKVIITNDPSGIESYTINPGILPDNFELEYSPTGIPIKIAVDSKGQILISASTSFVTPIGVFEVTASKNVIPQSKNKLLIIQIDNKVHVYELDKGAFTIEFYNNDEFYKILSFSQKSNGDIELLLEAIK